MGWRRVPSFPIEQVEDPYGELRRDPGLRCLRLSRLHVPQSRLCQSCGDAGDAQGMPVEIGV